MPRNQFPPFERPVTRPPSKSRRCSRKGAKYYCRLGLGNLFICCVLVAYTSLGALLFLYIETDEDEPPEEDLTSQNNTFAWVSKAARKRLVEKIWDITIKLNILYRENWTRLAGHELYGFQEDLVYNITEEFARNQTLQRQTIEWTYPRAFLYSLSVLTTVGFGGFTPKTRFGKIATILYALFGIPLMILYLSAIGSVLSECTKGVCSRTLCCCLCSKCGYCCYDEKRMLQKERRMKRKRELEELRRRQMSEPYFVRSGTSSSFVEERDSEDDSDVETAGTITAPLTLCFMIMTIYIMVGGLILFKYEAWPYLDCCYFCFVCLSTINISDVIVSKYDMKGATLWILSFYILTGLALTAMCFNILHEELLKRLKNQIMGIGMKKETRTASTIADDVSPEFFTPS